MTWPQSQCHVSVFCHVSAFVWISFHTIKESTCLAGQFGVLLIWSYLHRPQLRSVTKCPNIRSVRSRTPTPLTGGMFWGRSDDYSLFSGYPKERRHDEPKDSRSITKHHCWPHLKGWIVCCHLASPSQPKPRLKIILPRMQVLPCFQGRLYQWEELAFGMSQGMEATTRRRSWGPLGPSAGVVSSGPTWCTELPASVPCLDVVRPFLHSSHIWRGPLSLKVAVSPPCVFDGSFF